MPLPTKATKELLINLGIDKMSNEEITNEFYNLSLFLNFPRRADNTWERNSSINLKRIWLKPENYYLTKQVLPEVKTEILYLLKFSNWSQKSIWSKFNIDIETLKVIEYEYNKNLIEYAKINKLDGRSVKRKITPKLIHTMQSYMNRHGGQCVTVNDIIKFLKVYHKDLWPISETSIRRVLKNHLDMSYTKAEKRSIKTASNYYTRRIFETIWIVEELKKRDWETIYFDEFKYNTHSYKFYNWSYKNTKNYILEKGENEEFNWIVALSNKGTYGLQCTDSTGDSNFMMKFISDLCIDRNQKLEMENQKFVFLMDNASVHKSDSMKSFLSSSNMRSITICPYSLHLNPAEKLIQAIKAKLKKHQAQNKYRSRRLTLL